MDTPDKNHQIYAATIGSQIAAAIVRAARQTTKDVLAANAAEKKSANTQDLSFDIRGQILSNASILWTTIRSDLASNSRYRYHDSRPTVWAPPMFIVARSVNDLFVAEVRLQQPGEDGHTHQNTFVEGTEADSVEQALQYLLLVTTQSLGAREYDRRNWIKLLKGDEYVPIGEAGMMWAPDAKYDDCGEEVWM
ncbi:hypothetical protein LTR56_025198 [Elasticomyces elasticus]|nr:hypothetical protein LTR56_025198 [Elasticomyces elasticus]KAK3649263.1 hypothetical protein LTR22_012992 [Elasticomyces elasticus]KAK4928203.1 hypothetical protein LTR49_005141 [Elasticomyces elasticus]KAK5765957.1 hypothetical protein LTS12_003964 [Elasticomyces elasticus]